MIFYNLCAGFMRLLVGILSIHYLDATSVSFNSFHSTIICIMTLVWVFYPLIEDLQTISKEVKK